MSTVCLFDIDGTLLNSGGAGQCAMEAALLETFGVTGPYTDIKAAGRTDKAITTDLFAHHQLEMDGDNSTRFMASYLKHLPAALTKMDGVVLPGIVELLSKLQTKEVTLGLLTGNFESGARTKLEHYDLHSYFPFGGFGDVHHDRDDVARLALAEASRFSASEIDPNQVWVIGDTPSDVTCARAIGAKVLAVATGIYDRDVLEPTEADVLLDDLSDVDEVVKLLST